VGPSGSKKFGQAIKTEGTYLAIGDGAWSGDGFTETGQVSIYSWGGTAWNLDQELNLSTNRQGHEHFGIAIDLYDNHLFVGAPNQNIGSRKNAGKVWVYCRSGASWILLQEITAPYPVKDEAFGTSVHLTLTNELLVGAPNRNNRRLKRSGAVHTYQKSGTTWNYHRLIESKVPYNFGLFGTKVDSSIDGDIFIGEPGYDIPARNQGRIHWLLNIDDTNPTIITSQGERVNALIGKHFSANRQDGNLVFGTPRTTEGSLKYSGSVSILLKIIDEATALQFGDEIVFYGDEQVVFG
jgi:hypothetical protein